MINVNNIQIKSENSTICGFITDFETGEPIIEAWLDFFIDDDQGHHYDYSTTSDENGYYLIENVVAGICIEYGAHADGYHFYWGTGGFEVPENKTVWVNMSMYPLQPKTSIVCGYVYDNYTSEPIYNIPVYYMWFDIHGQLSYGGGKTDENGYYSIGIGAGKFFIHTYTESHVNTWKGYIYVNDSETVWVNFSLDPEIIVEIIKPDNGFYFRNIMIFPFCFPIIIGSVDIEINVTLYGGNPIDHVEILINNNSKYNFTSEPYVYHWDNKTPLKFRHKLKIIAHRNWDSDCIKEIEVWKFF